MNNLLQTFHFTDAQILLSIPVISMSIEQLLTNNISKFMLASCYGFFFTTLAKMYGNQIKN